MCGRMVLTRTAHEIAEVFETAQSPGDWELGPRYNVAPSQNILAIRGEPDGGRSLSLLHWGLIPAWAKERSVGYRMINARSETAAEKPSFRKAMRARRCIVPIDGFYEWQSPGAVGAAGAGASPGQTELPIQGQTTPKPVKTPHFFRRPTGSPMAIAGLWESWTDRITGEVVESCTLLTTEANADVRPVHHRMPVFLAAADHARWLDPNLSDTEPLQSLLMPAPPGYLKAIRVGTRVNNPRNEDPRCIEPAS
ncbi:MAG TPA: SOS response-associated peptidase [Myxococcales bacterium]|nr:SOS response-associated peptidase [Myxococcales bacterium]